MAVLAAVLYLVWFRGGGDSVKVTTAVADVGPLVVKIVESGEIEAERSEVIRNEVHWPVYIKSLAPNGARVKEGEEIVSFDCQDLMDAIDVQNNTVLNATNDYTQAVENTKLQKKLTDYNIFKAGEAVKDAKDALKRYEDSDWKIQKNDAEAAIQMADRDLKLAQEKLNFKIKANEDPELKNPYSKSEIEADTLGVARLKLAYEKAVTTRDMLIKFDNPMQLRKLNLAIADAQMTEERTKVERETQVQIAQANEDSKKFVLKNQQKRLKELNEEAAKLTVKAKRDGLVVYNLGGNRWDRPNIVVEVGTQLAHRQQIMIIPDMTSLRVKTRVYEAMRKQVQEGALAKVRLDVDPNVVLTGRVDRIEPLADAANWMNPSAKYYNMYIKLDSLPPNLNPTMTAQVEVIVDQVPQALTVPVAAVFTEQEQRYCFLSNAGRWERRLVQTGRMSDQRVEITSGLSKGDVVMLNPPPNMLPAPKPADTDRRLEPDLVRPTERATSQPQPSPTSRRAFPNGHREIARQ